MRRVPAESLFSVAVDRKWLAAEEYTSWLDATNLLSETRRQVEELSARAVNLCEAERERGYREGKEAAAAELAEQRIRMAAEMVAALRSLEGVVVRLVLDCLQVLLGETTQEQRIVALVQGALQSIRDEQKVTVRVAPANVEIIRRRIVELARQGTLAVEIVPDPSLGESSCLLETPTGFVEADLEKQVQSLRRALCQAMGLPEESKGPRDP